MKMTSHQKCVAIMAHNKKQEWFFAKDIINLGTGDWYVGYEASARMSELAKKFPDMIESMNEGKYTKRRIRWETMDLWFEDLPKEYRQIFHKAGLTRELRRNPHETSEPEPVKDIMMKNSVSAMFIGHDPFGLFRRGQTYTLEYGTLDFSKPLLIKVGNQFLGYKDYKTFTKTWKIQNA